MDSQDNSFENKFLNKSFLIKLISVLGVAGLVVLVFLNRGDSSPLPIISENNQSNNVKLSKDPEGAKIDLDELDKGCIAGKDCIPSIDDPTFETPQEASSWLNPEDRIFGVKYNGVVRAYPQRIMNWHEIVNDDFNGEALAVTFCPLCGTAETFKRVVNGEVAEFGVSGMLYNSDLVMYDRIEGSLWQQITGQAIVGEAAKRNEVLKKVPTITTTWEEWLQANPNTQVLSINTGFSRDYDRYPYNTYEEDGELYFGVQNSDDRMHPKAVVYGIEVGENAKAYSQDYLEATLLEGESFEDTVAGETILISRAPADEYTFVNTVSNENYIPLRSFWFAWAAFHPATELLD